VEILGAKAVASGLENAILIEVSSRSEDLHGINGKYSKI
jgi:hypothetical protein